MGLVLLLAFSRPAGAEQVRIVGTVTGVSAELPYGMFESIFSSSAI